MILKILNLTQIFYRTSKSKRLWGSTSSKIVVKYYNYHPKVPGINDEEKIYLRQKKIWKYFIKGNVTTSRLYIDYSGVIQSDILK